MRKRDINKVLNQYQTIENGKKVKINVSEIFNIRDYAIEKYRNARGDNDHRFLYSLILTALDYGVAIGYNSGRRDRNNKTKKKGNNKK